MENEENDKMTKIQNLFTSIFWKFTFCYRTHFSTCLNEMELHDNYFYFVGDDVYHYKGDSSEKQKSRDVKKL